MELAVTFIIFRRPDATEKVFEAIRKVKPRKLLVIADGPRGSRIGEAENCAAARMVIDRVDWDCEVYKNYSDVNLGCAKRVSSGLDWAFNLVEETIVLEDDCIPHPTFFQYCSELLKYYKYDERIMSVCGLSVPSSFRRDDFSYCFSLYQRCWGWATWKRAWQYYDHDMALWPQVLENKLLAGLFSVRAIENFWNRKFQEVYDNEIDSWAYRWMLSCWLQSGMSILPEVNLISNIGFTAEATHTANDSFAAQLTTQELKFPLRHPPFVIRDSGADLFIQRTRHSAELGYRIQNKIKRLLRN